MALSSVVFFDRLGSGGPAARTQQMPHAFTGSLWYVAAAFTAAFAVLFALPRTAGTRQPETDGTQQEREAEPVPVG